MYIQPIPKIPLGGSKEVTDATESEFYRIYIPTRWGGTLTVTTDNGWLELYYPDTSTKIAAPDTNITYTIPFERDGEPVDEHGWYYVKHGGASFFTISNTFIQEGVAAYRPWNFWYYPLLKDELYPERNLYGEGGALDKYDTVFGTEAREYEEVRHGGYINPKTGKPWEGWEGHCWGAVVASILLPQPWAVTYRGQWFNQEEMEGLVAKLADTRVDRTIHVHGIPGIKPVKGTDKTDEFVHKFHTGLVEYVRKERKPLQSNLRETEGIDPEAVWNHAIYKYISVMEEAEEGEEDIIKIATTIYANEDTFPSDNTIDRIETYVYKLRYKSNGLVSKKFPEQDWISATGFAPQNLWYISGSKFNNKDNPYLIRDNVERLGINFP